MCIDFLKAFFRAKTILIPIVIIAFMLLHGGAASALSGAREITAHYQNLTILIDGRTIIPKDASGRTVYPFVYNDRTYLPVRALANSLGCGVAWNDADRIVSISSSGGPGPSYGAPVKKGYSEKITINYDNISVALDGKKLVVENEPFLFMDSVYLPLREIADALKCSVSYDDVTCAISIKSASGAAGPTSPAPSAAPSATTATAAPAASAATAAPGAPATAAATAPAATTAPSATPAAANAAGSFSSSDMTFIIAGKAVKLDQNISVIRELLGAPKEYDEVESCAYTGFDKFFAYNGLEVCTLPIDGDLICSIDVLNNSYKTEKDITVGSALTQIEAAYGTGYTYENGVLIYWAGAKGNPKTPQLYFMMTRNDTVGTFGMYNGKSAG